MAASVDFDGDDDLLLLGFHGFGNDEHEMIRIIDALYAGTGREPNYISFRGTYDRPLVTATGIRMVAGWRNVGANALAWARRW